MSKRRKEKQTKKVFRSARYIGPLINDTKYAVWKYGSLKTMEELFEKGALNQNQIEMLYDRGIDIQAKVMKKQLSQLDLENDDDFLKFTELVQKNPSAIKLISEVERDKKRAITKEHKMQLKEQISKLDLDTPQGMQEFAALAKENPEAVKILEKLHLEG